MSLDSYHTQVAKRLAALVAEQGDVAVPQISATVRALVGKEPLATRRAFCTAFLGYLEREIQAREVRIEHAGPVSAAEVAAIVAHYSAGLGYSLTPRLVQNDELLGGLRLRVGDNVYDASVAGALDRLAHTVR